MEAFVEIASVDASVEAFTEFSVEAFMEAFVEIASVDASVEAFTEFSVEAFMEASTPWKRGSFHQKCR